MPKTLESFFRAWPAVLSTALAVIGAVIWLHVQLSRIDTRLALIESRITSRWTAQDQQVWALKLALDNPTLKVPAVTEPKQATP